MIEKILSIVDAKHKLSNGTCGTYLADFLNILNVTDADFKNIVREMHKNKQVEVREGINGFMIMKFSPKNQNLNRKIIR